MAAGELSRELAAVVLAAGKGKRMHSPLPKVLHPLLGRPMILYVLDLVRAVGADRTVVIVGHGWQQVAEAVRGDGVEIAIQEPQLGTAHAVQQAGPALGDFAGDVLVLAGDSPLFTARTLKRLVNEHRRTDAAATILTAWADDPTGCGRIVLDEEGQLLRIVEEKDADPATKAIRRVNTSTYVFRAPVLFEALREVRNDNAQGEYYLTDVFEILRGKGLPVRTVLADSFEETMGINTVEHLRRAEDILKKRLAHQGVSKGSEAT